MIKTIPSIESIETDVRHILLAQSQLDGNHVLNALNVRGPSMTKPAMTVGEEIFESMSHDESVLIFELVEIEESLSETDTDDSIFAYVQLALKLTLYGKSSRTLSQMLKARLLSSEIRDAFFEIGLNLQKINDIGNASEFVNGILWQRQDMQVDFSCHLAIDKLIKNVEFDKSSDSIVVDKIDE